MRNTNLEQVHGQTQDQNASDPTGHSVKKK